MKRFSLKRLLGVTAVLAILLAVYVNWDHWSLFVFPHQDGFSSFSYSRTKDGHGRLIFYCGEFEEVQAARAPCRKRSSRFVDGNAGNERAAIKCKLHDFRSVSSGGIHNQSASQTLDWNPR